jgi:hypothetical protein
MTSWNLKEEKKETHESRQKQASLSHSALPKRSALGSPRFLRHWVRMEAFLYLNSQ